MNRFFIDPHDVSGDSIVLDSETFDHIRVLRLRPNESFIVCDAEGNEYECCLGDNTDDKTVKIIKKYLSTGEPNVKCFVFSAYTKGERLEYTVQKSVELGAHEIILFESERCVAIPRDILKKTDRLQRIALEAAKQCNRGIIPNVMHGGRFTDILNKADECSDLPLLFYECEKDHSVKNILEQYFPASYDHINHKINSVSIITGPEGGFEPREIDEANSKDIRVVSLGPRILRSETAPVVALTAVMYHTGNL